MSGVLGTKLSQWLDGLWLTGLEEIFCRHSSSLEVENPDLCPVWPGGQVSIHAVKYHRRHLLLPLPSPLMTCADQTLTLEPDFHPSKWGKSEMTEFLINQFPHPLSWEKVLSFFFPLVPNKVRLWQIAAKCRFLGVCKLNINAKLFLAQMFTHEVSKSILL